MDPMDDRDRCTHPSPIHGVPHTEQQGVMFPRHLGFKFGILWSERLCWVNLAAVAPVEVYLIQSATIQLTGDYAAVC